MKEDFLHYLWSFQKFQGELLTESNEILEVLNPGLKNSNSGPDFFNARIIINNQHWAGNVEIHVKSSDWYAHHHEADDAYNNVILHVVWEHDLDVFRKDNSVLPTLVLKNKVHKSLVTKYRQLVSKKQQWINCENEFALTNKFLLKNWFERLYLERLEQKTLVFNNMLSSNNNDWEALLFVMLAKNFGLKVNGEAFFSMARSVPFSVIKKCSLNGESLEALLLGQAGLLDKDKDDAYYMETKRQYRYLKTKYQLSNESVIKPKFFKLRPSNFPTIRISQLANLFSNRHSLFSHLIEAKTVDDYYKILSATASVYWDTHYNFMITSSKRRKSLTKKFINLLLINTIIPLKFCFANYIGKPNSEEILTLISGIPKEENAIVLKFNKLSKVVQTALDSQAVIQLKNHYCDNKKCLQCAIGNAILKSNRL